MIGIYNIYIMYFFLIFSNYYLAPGALVLLTPFAIGMIVGPQAIAGLLPGALVSAVSMATA